MSQTLTRDAHAATEAVAGNTARVLSLPGVKPDAPSQVRRRTPLSLVPARKSRGRVPFAVFSMLALVAALVMVLMLNISVSSSQYKLVSLRGQEAALAQQNQALTQQLDHMAAPQNLAVAAAELDMVASPTFGTVDVNSLKVSGSPEAAKKSDAPPVLVPEPAVNTTNTVPAPIPYNPSPETVGEPSATAGASAEVPQPRVEAAAETEPVEPPKPEGGGSIPAPQQSTPGQ